MYKDVWDPEAGELHKNLGYFAVCEKLQLMAYSYTRDPLGLRPSGLGETV